LRPKNCRVLPQKPAVSNQKKSFFSQKPAVFGAKNGGYCMQLPCKDSK